MILQFINVFPVVQFFRRVREDFQATHTLAPFSFTHTSSNTTLAFIALHLKSNGYIPLFLEDYDLECSFDSFKLTFQCMPHLLTNGLLKWFLNTFGTIFIQKIQQMDSLNCFNFVFILHKVTFHLELHVSLEWPTSQP